MHRLAHKPIGQSDMIEFPPHCDRGRLQRADTETYHSDRFARHKKKQIRALVSHKSHVLVLGMLSPGSFHNLIPSPIQSGTGTNAASVGCTEGGGGRLVGVDSPYFCCCSSCGSEVVSWRDPLLVGGNTALVARPYEWCGWDRGSQIVIDGGTNFRNKRLFLNDRRPEPFTFTQLHNGTRFVPFLRV